MTSHPLPGAPFLAYQEGELCLEEVRLADLAQAHGTPLFVYSKAAMLAALDAYRRGFAGRNAHVHYAMKANSSLAILQVFAQAGCGFDIVSGGELERVIAAGGDPAKVIFSGVGKTRAEMRQALRAGIECFKCVSVNGSNPACEDPFHNNRTISFLEKPCMGGRKNRDGLFPASACIKLHGRFSKLLLNYHFGFCRYWLSLIYYKFINL